ncbi:MAG TPA: FAD:protein FMN transferase [Acidimicrobiia bacterium]|jgi:thiamine biosynthesis lipoprotein
MTTATAPTWSDVRFPAMGSTARLLVLGGPPDLPERARARLAWLEARWSRFEPTSDVSRVNAAGGRPVVVSPETFEVVALAIDCWRATAGAFDPTVLDALERVGYDRDFAAVGSSTVDREVPAPARPAPGCAGIELLPRLPAVRLPPGVRIDLGGIGKGRAADLLAGELRAAGADGVCVDLGGDVRVTGTAPEPAGWRVLLDRAVAPHPGFLLAEGGVATSTRLRRRWTRGGTEQHHLVDPASGDPARTGLAAVTVVAAHTAGAEVLAKAAFVAGPEAGPELLRTHGVTGLLVADDGSVRELAGLGSFRA